VQRSREPQPARAVEPVDVALEPPAPLGLQCAEAVPAGERDFDPPPLTVTTAFVTDDEPLPP